MATIIASILAWILRSINYCYLWGYYSVYNIDKCYIKINCNLLFEVMFYISLVIILFLLNLLYLAIAIREPLKRIDIVRTSFLFLILLIESIAIFFVVMFTSYSFEVICQQMKNTSFMDWILIITMCFYCSFSFNMIAFIEALEYRKKARASEESKVEEGKNEKEKTQISIKQILMIVAFFFGITNSNNRTSYKVILKENNNQTFESLSTLYDFESRKMIVYPIIFENDDIYIISCLKNNGKENYVNSMYQMIIKKENVETYNIDITKPVPIKIVCSNKR